MPLPNNVNSYADVKVVLDAALAAGGGVYKLKTEKEAVRWRQRAYHFRKLAQRQAAAGSNLANYQPPTPYDSMHLTIEGPKVLIGMIRPAEGVLVLPDGSEIVPEIPKVSFNEKEKQRLDEEEALHLAALKLIGDEDEES